jgi:hypothetical protein
VTGAAGIGVPQSHAHARIKRATVDLVRSYRRPCPECARPGLRSIATVKVKAPVSNRDFGGDPGSEKPAVRLQSLWLGRQRLQREYLLASLGPLRSGR